MLVVDAWRRWGASLAVAWAVLTTAPARLQAHAGPPRATAVTTSDANPSTVVVTTTFGLVLSHDGGVSWSWLCGDGVGFDSEIELPELVVLDDGSLAVGTFNGLARSSPDSCSWAPAEGDAGHHYFVGVEHVAGGAALMRTNGLGGFRYEVDLRSSSDGGATWSALGAPPPEDFLPFDLACAATAPDRLYLVGRDGGEGSLAEVVMRSDDGGESWSRLPLPRSRPDVENRLVLHPTDPDRLVVWSGDVGDEHLLFSSSDGGVSFDVLLESPSELTGVAFSPDGAQLAVGSAEGLDVLSLAEGTWRWGASLAVGCLTWTRDGLLACADETDDGFAVGRSTDGGATFEPFMLLSSPCGPPVCGAESGVAVCEAQWAIESEELGATCDLAPETDPEPGGDVGAVTSPPAGGCAVGGRDDGESRRWALLVLALGLLRRRPR